MTHPNDTDNSKVRHHEIDPYTLKMSASHSKTLQTSDIVALVQNRGKVTLNGKELVLKSPSLTDSTLQEIVNEPTLSIKPLGTPTKNGECEFELRSSKRVLKIKINCKEHK